MEIKCMDLGFSNGLMGEFMKENILWIKNKAREFSFGLMEESMLDSGPMESNMGLVLLWQLMVNKGMVSGIMGRE